MCVAAIEIDIAMYKKILFVLMLWSYMISMSCFAAVDTEVQDRQSRESNMSIDYKKQTDAFWKNHLTQQVYNICRARGTERAGSGTYDKFYEKGTYYCACCGGDHALFSSATKFDSGTGWPSFWAPINAQSVELHNEDRIVSRWLGAKTEVRCARCGSHLGHVFDDGPAEHTGKRYCMNSLALAFVHEGDTPKERLLQNN